MSVTVAQSPPPPRLGEYKFVEETKEELDWAPLPTVDLSQTLTAEGKAEQARILADAVKGPGFFYVKNFGIPQEDVNRQFAIGRELYELPLEEKLKYVPDLANGNYNGYWPSGRREIVDGLRDRVEVYNIPKFSGHFPHNHPKLVNDHLPEIEQFQRDLHKHVLNPLLVLIAIALGLPENYLTELHKYDDKSEDHLRYMKYSKYTPEENERLGHTWVRGHTDLGTVTLLFRQPVAALQIQDHTTETWSWVKPQDGTLTVNACDALSFLTDGLFRSTIHRVRSPPRDQQHVDRLGLLYFARPRNDLKLEVLKESPVLRDLGITHNEFEKIGKVPTMEEWTFSKQKWQQSGRGGAYGTRDATATIVPGFQERRYD